jgi:hypothetical protein
LLFSCASRDAPFLGDPDGDIVDVLGYDDDVFERFRVTRDDSPTPPITTPDEPPQLKPAPPAPPAPTKTTETTAPVQPPAPTEQPKVEAEPVVVPDPVLKVAPKRHRRPKITATIEELEEEGGIEYSGKEYPDIFFLYDDQSRKIWNSYKPLYFPNEEKHFAIKYLGITAGHIKVSTRPMARINDRPVMHYQGHMRSARFYEYIYRLDDSIETYVDAQTQVPIRYTLIQRESKQDVDDFQFFDHQERKTYFRYKRVRSNDTREEERIAFTPELFQDSFSALFFARGLPYKVGDIYEFPIITRARLWMLKMEVETIEEVRVMRQRIPAYRVRAITRFPGVLERRGDILFWFSADDKKRLLRFRANVKVGAIEGELTDYQPGLPTPEF